jgi:hypothetical protein
VNNCPKKAYPTHRQALKALRATQRRAMARQRTAPTGAYLCPTCRRYWHLTSKSGIQGPPWLRPGPEADT